MFGTRIPIHVRVRLGRAEAMLLLKIKYINQKILLKSEVQHSVRYHGR